MTKIPGLSQRRVAAILAILVLSSLASLRAAPFAEQIEFTQPNGSVIKLWGQGDDFYAVFETLDGYTVVYDQSLRAYCYAQLSSDASQLLSTGQQVLPGQPAPASVARHLRISTAAIKSQAAQRFARWDAGMEVSKSWAALKSQRRAIDGGFQPSPPSSTTVGTKVGLTLLIDFSDDPATISQAQVIDYCNGDAYTDFSNNGSVKKYFYDVSNGLLTYSNVVTVYIRMALPKTYYCDTEEDAGQQANYMIRDAIAIMKAMPNYATEIQPMFDNLTVDSQNQAVACNVFYAGGNGGVWQYGLWPHSWSLYVVGAQSLSSNRKVFKYQVTNIGSSLKIGTFCHENGHMLCGFPDIYDYDYDSTGGAGMFSLMGSGNYGGGGGNPVQVDAYLKRAAGWATTVDLTSSNSLLATVTDTLGTTNFNRFFRCAKPGVATEYFLAECRHQSGRDAALPASGVAIWHVDELGNRDNQSLAPNSTHSNYELTLVQADNLWHFEHNNNSGDACDLYYLSNSAAAYNNRFNDASAPNANWWDGTTSGISFHDFSAQGATMTFIVGAVELNDALDDTSLEWASDGNVPWAGGVITTHDGLDAAQSGAIGNSQQSRLVTTVPGPGTLSFWWKVSSETNFDYVRVRIGGTEYDRISGEVDWEQQTIPIPAGYQTVEWIYSKNAYGSGGSDAAWVDQVVFTATPTPPSIVTQPASQSVANGASASFSVVASGSVPLYYMWRQNADPMANATNTSLTLSPAGASDAGSYTVVITNSFGAVTSSIATLTIVSVDVGGDDTMGQSAVPTSATNLMAVAAGAWHNLAVRADGTVIAWGNNANGQCDVPTNLTKVVAVAAGGYHSLALRANQTVTGWGANASGQVSLPSGLSNVIAIAAGSWHSLALRADGSVLAWGDDTWGQTEVPSFLTNAIAIAAGGNHSLALQADGSVIGWGENTDASGTYVGQSVPPWNLTNAVAIAAGDYHSLAVKADGTIVAWGDDSEGQTDVPETLAPAVQVAGGGSHTLALLADGTIAAWGNDWNGQCDLSPGLSNLVAVAAGNVHSIVLERDTPSPAQPQYPVWQDNRFSTLLLTAPGTYYTLEYKTAMDATNWTALPATYGNGAYEFLVDRNANDASRFYRIKQ